jgi:ADP-ribose pyrophosphatase
LCLKHESVEKCGLREALQKAGVKPSSSSKAIDLGVHDPDSGLLKQQPHLFAYTAVEVDSTKIEPDHSEALGGYVLLAVEDLLAKIKSGEITDSFTVAAVFRARLHGLI